jgi:hypothetical protein
MHENQRDRVPGPQTGEVHALRGHTGKQLHRTISTASSRSYFNPNQKTKTSTPTTWATRRTGANCHLQPGPSPSFSSPSVGLNLLIEVLVKCENKSLRLLVSYLGGDGEMQRTQHRKQRNPSVLAGGKSNKTVVVQVHAERLERTHQHVSAAGVRTKTTTQPTDAQAKIKLVTKQGKWIDILLKHGSACGQGTSTQATKTNTKNTQHQRKCRYGRSYVSCDRSRNKKIFLPWLMSVGFAIQIP